MLGFRSLLLLASTALFVNAQNYTADIQACLRSTDIVDFSTEVTYSTTDDTHYRNATYMYDPVVCTRSTVPIQRIATESEQTGTRYICTSPKVYDNTGVIYSQCSVTLGTLARAAETGDDVWFMSFTAGSGNATVSTSADYYTITPHTEPEPSGGAAQRRRRARALQQLPFKCEQGFSYCPTGPDTFGCTDTSSNLISCGACPSDPNSKDCSNIDGANHVECRGGDCYVNSCLRGYQVSADRKSCRPFARRR